MEYKDSNPRKTSRKNTKKAKRRKSRAAGALIFLIAIILTIGITLSLTVFFKIENISITGNSYYTAEQISENCGVKVGDNLFLTSKQKIETSLKNEYPYVEQVKLERILPSTIRIVVSEASEHYCIEYGGEYYTASINNRVLSKYSALPAGLISIKLSSVNNVKIGEYFTVDSEDEANHFKNLIGLLEAEQITFSSIDMSDLLQIKVKVADRFMVNFGSGNDLLGKVSHLSSMLKSMSTEQSGTINLSAWSPEKTEGYFVQGNMQ